MSFAKVGTGWPAAGIAAPTVASHDSTKARPAFIPWTSIALLSPRKPAAAPARPHSQAPADLFESADARVPMALAIFAVAMVVRLVHVLQIRHAPFFTVLMGDSH